MKKAKNILIILIQLFICQLLLAQKKVDLAIKDVTIIDVKNGKAIPHQHVFINNNRIIAITNQSKSWDAKKVITASNKFLIPGLWDMHTHNWWQIHFSDHYIKNGVLGVRNMYTPMNFINPLKDSINSNKINGPKYIAAGRVIEGTNPEFPDWLVVDSIHKIKKALDTLQMEGSDFVKVYNKIPKEVYFELMKESAKRGLSVQGHLPMSVNAIDASNAGQKSFEHLLGIPDLCTSDSLFKNKYKFNWFAAVMREDDYGTIKIDESLAKKNFSVLKNNNTYICPTLVVWNNLFHPDIPFESNSLINKFPKDMTAYWMGEIDRYRKKDAAYKQMALKKMETFKKITLLLYQSGVPLIAGTDAINPFCYPGYSLHDELVLLKDCGIPDADVLKMATCNAAEFLQLKEYGQIKVGNIASLVLLNANPLKNIKNTKNIDKVFLNGKQVL
ncbi:MAG: amidohydrolase family protein [Sphingobacteriia bacterium]|jgi:imidazolonepropionase-like amidohydrolase